MNDATTKPGEYVVVARRYRPQSFESLIGQEQVARALVGAIESGRVGHAYLFTGARGVGKTSAARILAKALDCASGPTAHPCNECEICTSIAAGGDVDVIEIDGASNRGIDEIRQLRQNVAVRPSRARFKIYIIDEVHMLTKEAFNALLKTLEEPPEHVKFIFATTEANKIPITILSRCQRYDFAGIEATAIHRRLSEIAAAEGVEADSEALQIIAIRAAGSMRDSQSLLEQLLATGSERITAEHVTSLLGLAPASRLSRLVLPLVERNAAVALAELDATIAEGAEVGQLIDQLLGYFRDALTQSVGCDENQMLYALPSQREELRGVAGRLGVQTLLAILQILDQTAARLRISTQVRTLGEMALVRICQLENLDELAALIADLKTGEAPRSPAAAQPRALPGGTSRAAPSTDATSDASKKNSAVNPPRPHMLDRGGEPVALAASPIAAPSECAPVQPRALPGGSDQTEAWHATESAEGRGPDADESLAPSHSIAPRPSRTQGVAPQNPPAEPGAETMRPPMDAEQLWKQTLEALSGMVYEHAAAAERMELSPDGRLTVSFPDTTEGKFSRDNCQRPANIARIETALTEAASRRVPLVFTLHEATADAAGNSPKAPSAKEQHAALLANPFVQRAVELFAADTGRMTIISPPSKG